MTPAVRPGSELPVAAGLGGPEELEAARRRVAGEPPRPVTVTPPGLPGLWATDYDHDRPCPACGGDRGSLVRPRLRFSTSLS